MLANYIGGLRSIDDYKRAKQQFELDKQLKQAQVQQAQARASDPYGGASVPAAIQLTNEYEKAVQAGDMSRANKIAQFAKIYDKGLERTQEGQFAELPGYGAARGSIEAQKAGMTEQAKQIQKTAFEPQREALKEEQKLQQQLEYRPQIKQQEARAASRAQATSELGERKASLPQLERTVQELSRLGKEATYTLAGRGADIVRREAGLPVGEGAVARREYTSLVDNQILPLLRQTFGAQFTEREGQSLKATLGDPNASPEEKDAVLRSFIDQKKQQINTMERQLGQPLTEWEELELPQAVAPAQTPSAPKKGTIQDGYVFMGGDPSNPKSWKKK